MKLMRPQKRLLSLFFPITLIALLFSSPIHAQSKKTSSKKAVAKKSVASAKDARKDKKATSRKDQKKDQVAKKKDSRKDSRNEKATAKARESRRESKKENRREKETAKDRREKERDTKNKKLNKAEARRVEAERRREAEARRQAALAEQRRREQAAREARARKLAFERGLRTATIDNIAKDDTTGEDLQVRRAAVNALGGHAGTVVVMEAKTGKVLTIVNQNWAIRDSFKPCSTIKLVTGVAGINENIIDDNGKVTRSSMSMNLDYALAKSNNTYFQKVGINMGSPKMIAYAKSLGLGEKTGINADGETPGRLPYGNHNARIYSHGDDFAVTPLQLAVMVSALSNGGKKVVPQIPQSRVERTASRSQATHAVNLPMRSVEGVLPGMMGAAEYGTARRGVDASMGVAGKTGSCIERGSWVGLFASVAPVEDPKYSVVVITRGQSERGRYAAAIAGKVYQALGGQIKRNRDLLYARQLKAKPVVPVPGDEGDDGEESDVAEAEQQEERAPIVVGAPQTRVAAAQPAAAEKKLVQKTTQSKPSFSPVVIEFDKSGAIPSKTQRPRIVKNK
ncbi:MAG TPA: penicillin-binding transpeptidase domain-containing protein [Pyrinomonadaceae bacterium]|nr:penicillin-binding transpeptidase domain-containing protein [Pyrinomonadaceae bacterium]